MKKILSILMLITLVASIFTSTVSAAQIRPELSPLYNNVIDARASFFIDEEGLAEITVSYRSESGAVSSADIEIELQELVGSSWEDVTYWGLYSEDQNYTETIRTMLPGGRYKATITFTIEGRSTTPDVIVKELEAQYNE